jgi:tetratricopeptide (TPR) repeat protein
MADDQVRAAAAAGSAPAAAGAARPAPAPARRYGLFDKLKPIHILQAVVAAMLLMFAIRAGLDWTDTTTSPAAANAGDAAPTPPPPNALPDEVLEEIAQCAHVPFNEFGIEGTPYYTTLSEQTLTCIEALIAQGKPVNSDESAPCDWAPLRLQLLKMTLPDAMLPRPGIMQQGRIHANLASILVHQGDYEGALKEFSQGEQYEPRFKLPAWQAYFFAKANLEVGKTNYAISILKDALADPDVGPSKEPLEAFLAHCEARPDALPADGRFYYQDGDGNFGRPLGARGI